MTILNNYPHEDEECYLVRSQNVDLITNNTTHEIIAYKADIQDNDLVHMPICH